MSPKVSIITVCFNSAKTIRETIESVLSQDYPDIEYIVIDGGSIDETLAIVNEYADRISAVISEQDNGIYDAMNKGIILSSGDIVGMLNSDDIYFNNASVSTLINKMQVTGSDSVFSDLLVVDKNNPDKVVRYYDSSQFSPIKFKYGLMPAHPTFFMKKYFYNLYGLYSTEYKIAADYELLMRMLWTHKISHAYHKGPTVKMRSGGISTNGLKNSLILNKEIIKACRENDIYTNIIFLLTKLPKKIKELMISRNIKK